MKNRYYKLQHTSFISFCTLFLLIVSITTPAQNIFNGTGGSIPDFGSSAQFTINVSALDSPKIDTAFGLRKICFSINHGRVGDLGIYLIAPDGTVIQVSTGNGDVGVNYTNTCFSMSSAILIQGQTAPFTGIFVPEQTLGNMNNKQTGLGIWTLKIIDNNLGITGALTSWSLEFGASAPAPVGTSFSGCDEFSPLACVCPSGGTSCLLLPDVVVSSYFMESPTFFREYPNQIQVSTATVNVGYGPIEIYGTGQWYCGNTSVAPNTQCPDGTYAKQLVQQKIYKKNGSPFFDYIMVDAGKMGYDSDLGHNHLHVDHWVKNTLRIKGANPDPLTWPIVATGLKASSCVMDNNPCDSIIGQCRRYNKQNKISSLPNPGLGLGYDNCGLYLQGMSVGYYDLYDFSLAGQEINLSNLPNGCYYVVTQFDPNNVFQEIDKTNNVTIAKWCLTKQKDSICTASFYVDTLQQETKKYQFIHTCIPTPDSVLWNFGDGRISRDTFPIHQYTDTGTITISLISYTHNHCIDTAYFTLYLKDFCTANFKIDTLSLSQKKYQFTNTSTPTPDSVLWNFGDGNLSKTFSPTHQYSDTGTYTVKLISYGANGCTDTLIKKIVVKDSCCLNIQHSVLDKMGMVFYQNNNNPALMIETNTNIHFSTITLVDINGKEVVELVQKKEIPTGKNFYFLPDNIEGFFIVKLDTEYGQKRLKIVVTR